MPTTDLERLAQVRQLITSGEARRRRQQADLSLSEVAGACNVDTATVWRWETGRRRPRGEMALRYLTVLDKIADIADRGAAA